MNTTTPQPPSPLAALSGVVDLSDLRVSVSQFKKADRCARAYWYEYGPLKRKSPPSASMQLGTDVHAVLENYLEGAPIPETRAGRIASAGLKHLPDPETLEVEKNVLMPIGENGARILCRIDMVGRVEPYVGDHKTSSDFKWAASVWQVKNDLQLLTYAYAAYHENPPENVTVELIYYRTRGLPVSMKVSAVVEWPTVVENWEKLESRLPRLAEIRADETGESVVGNSAACGDYGGCFHCDVCPFSPQNSSKSASCDNYGSGVSAPIKTQTQKPKDQIMRKVTDQGKKLQTSLGLSRILPQGAPPQVEQPTALLKDAAAKLNGAVGFNGAITPSDALDFLERLGIDGDSLDEVLSLAGLEINGRDLIDGGLLRFRGPYSYRMVVEGEPTPEPTPEPEPTPSNGSRGPVAGHKDAEFIASVQRLAPGPGLFSKVNKGTLRALAAELLQKWPEGVAESDALAYCKGRITENRNIGARRWDAIVEFSEFTLDGGWLHLRNAEGFTEHPQAHDDESERWQERHNRLDGLTNAEAKTSKSAYRFDLAANDPHPDPGDPSDALEGYGGHFPCDPPAKRQTGAELDRAAYETKTGKKAPTVEAEPGAINGASQLDRRARQNARRKDRSEADEPSGFPFVEGVTKAEGMVTTGFLNDEPHVAVFIGESDTPLMIPAEALVATMCEVNPTAGYFRDAAAVASRLVVLVDCIPENGLLATPLSTWLGPFIEKVERLSQKGYWDRMKYNEPMNETIGQVVAHCHANHPEGVLTLDSRCRRSLLVLEVLRTLDSVTVIRGLR